MPGNTLVGRKRISQACRPCRSRKVKCDGVYPRCGRCVADAVTCLYEVSRRNKRVPSPASKALQAIHPSTLDGTEPFSPSTSENVVKNGFDSQTIQIGALYWQGISEKLDRDKIGRLLQIFFRHIHPIWPILYKPMYDSLDSFQLLNSIPAALINAMLSISVLLDDSEETQHPDLSKHDQAQFFFRQALKLLSDTEDDPDSQHILATKPTILHCQTLTILALQQHGIAAFSQAGILCGVAAAMAIDLRLHRVSETGNSIELETKSRLWWNIYVLEKMLSCEMNRPMILRAEEADAPFPSVNESDEFELYSGWMLQGHMPVQPNSEPLKLHTISSFHTSIRISMIIENISRHIYSVAAQSRIRNNRLEGEEIRQKLWADLHSWERAVECSLLKLDTSEALTSGNPVIVTNYVYMWSTTILLHRPFIEHWQRSGSQESYSASAGDPFEVCIFAANQICTILGKYHTFLNVLPCDLVFPIFVAANIFLRRWRQAGTDSSLIRPQLELCIQWLNALGKSWKSAEGRQQILVESLNTGQPTQVEEQNMVSSEASSLNEGEIAFNDFSNFTTLTMEDDFDLEYMQWIMALE